MAKEKEIKDVYATLLTKAQAKKILEGDIKKRLAKNQSLLDYFMQVYDFSLYEKKRNPKGVSAVTASALCRAIRDYFAQGDIMPLLRLPDLIEDDTPNALEKLWIIFTLYDRALDEQAEAAEKKNATRPPVKEDFLPWDQDAITIRRGGVVVRRGDETGKYRIYTLAPEADLPAWCGDYSAEDLVAAGLADPAAMSVAQTDALEARLHAVLAHADRVERVAGPAQETAEKAALDTNGFYAAACQSRAEEQADAYYAILEEMNAFARKMADIIRRAQEAIDEAQTLLLHVATADPEQVAQLEAAIDAMDAEAHTAMPARPKPFKPTDGAAPAVVRSAPLTAEEGEDGEDDDGDDADDAEESVEETPAEEPAEETPAEEPAAEIPAEEPAEVPAEEPATETPAEEPATETPVEEPAEETPVEEAAEEPVEETPVEEPAAEIPAAEAPAEEPATETPAEEPAAEIPAEEPAEETPAEEPAEVPVEETPAEEPATETPAEEPAAEVPAEEPAEETPAEEPAEETPEEKTVEELSAQELKKESVDAE